MTNRKALALILAIIIIGALAVYLTSTSYRTSSELTAAEALQPYCETRGRNPNDECDQRWSSAWKAMRIAQAPLDKKRNAQANLIGYTCVALISLITLAWLFTQVPRAWTYLRTKLAAHKAAQRAAKVALLADAIRAAQASSEGPKK